MVRHQISIVSACVACLALGGCGLGEWASNGFKVGPNYKTPAAPVAQNWIDFQRPEDQAHRQPAELKQWWQVFNDPVLNSLIADAYHQNINLRVAGERIVEARANRGIVVGNLFPQAQELAGGYTANKVSDRAPTGGQGQWFSDANVGFNLNWELDFWGRFRRSIESADASLDASIANYDDALVILLADVAANYIQYRSFQERLFLAHNNLQIQQEAYNLASDKFRLGNATERDAQQAKQVLEQTRASIPQLEAGLRQTNNALCVLLGIPPQELAKQLGETGSIPQGKPQWSLGLPADLLRRRPDVRRAEREAAVESASIGIIKSELYPRFSLTGSIGLRAEEIGDLAHTPGTFEGFGGPVFAWNILNYGQITNAVAAQEARFRQAVYRYKDTVLNANRQVEDAIINYYKAQERTNYLGDSVTAARRTVQITRDQYNQGVIDFTPVFLFETTLTTQEDDYAQSQAQIALSLVDVYRSLGGGWEAETQLNGAAAPRAPAPTTQRTYNAKPTTRPAAARP